MNLEENIKYIKKFLLNRYKNNLAAILIFGSANTGHFQEGKSDIDHMIFLKELRGLNLDEESKFLFEKLRKEHFSTQYFFTLGGIKAHIERNGRKGWSTYITIVSNDGSKIIYSTPEFESLRKELRKNPPTIKDIKKYIREKDEVELYGYFNEIEGYNLTRSMMAHLRRKMQIINYLKNKNFVFDYEKCLNNLDIKEEQKRKLREIYKLYAKKGGLSKKDIEYYMSLAEEFTKKITRN